MIKKVAEPLRPKKGGFLRPFGCGWFIREYLIGHGPYDTPKIDPAVGAPQADIFYHYKNALMRAKALDEATREEEKQARCEKRAIDPENIGRLTAQYLDHMAYKTIGCNYHSFVVYFSNLQRLGWVELTGKEEPSAFQDHYREGQPRKYFRLTPSGMEASDSSWANPHAALYSAAV